MSIKLECPVDDVLLDRELSINERTVYALIDANPGARIPYATFCAALHIGDGAIATATRSLERRGMIRVDRPKRHKGRKQYPHPFRYWPLVDPGGRRVSLEVPGQGEKSRVLLVALFDSTSEKPRSATETARQLGISTQQAQRARRQMKRRGFTPYKP